METALVPFSDLQGMAAVMAKSGMFGKTPDQMLSLMLIAQAENLHPAMAAQEYDVIQGRPALKSQAALARFQAAGGRVEWIERTDTVAEARFSHALGGTVMVRWDMAKATRMGLTGKDNWKKQPGVMLQWRCVAEGVRICYPACLNRMYLVEEVQDFEPIRNVTPTREARKADAESEPLIHAVDEGAPDPDPMSPEEFEESRACRAGLQDYIFSGILNPEQEAKLQALIDDPKTPIKVLREYMDKCHAQEAKRAAAAAEAEASA